MSILPIIKFPDAVLRTPAKEVESLTADMHELSRQMHLTMRAAHGVGLAAPQIGKSLRLIVVSKEADGSGAPLVLFNPQITESAEQLAEREEGCLSIPGITATVRRPATVTVVGLNADGEKQTVTATGLLAACLQHEIDHLNGVLFVDHLSPLKRERLLKKYLKSEFHTKSKEY
ncbi:MAG: peptide deformylase [Gammaproteobacteria bacterium WSBS_2016_MAG_OTU1]